MNRNIYTIAIALLSLIFVACDSNDDEIDKEWKKMNEDAYTLAYQNVDVYKKYLSASNNGTVLWKESNVLTDDDLTLSLRKTPQGTPEYTDSVTVRYEGWFYQKDGTRYTFDTTEGDYNKAPRSFPVNGVIDGWSTVLQNMQEGDEREIVIPWILGYGSSGSGSIPGYTTLYFRVKLIKILQMTGRTN